jgi:hypothetical protein
MNQQLPLALQIEEWTREAYILWGDNWERITGHIRARLAEMGGAERAKLTAEVSLTLVDPVGKKTDASPH